MSYVKYSLILILATISASCFADTVIIQNYTTQTDLYSNCQYQSQTTSGWSGYVQLQPATTDNSGKIAPTEQTVDVDCLIKFVVTKGGHKQCAAAGLGAGHSYNCFWKPDSTIFTKTYNAPKSYSCNTIRTFMIRDDKQGNIHVKVTEQRSQPKKK